MQLSFSTAVTYLNADILDLFAVYVVCLFIFHVVFMSLMFCEIK